MRVYNTVSTPPQMMPAIRIESGEDIHTVNPTYVHVDDIGSAHHQTMQLMSLKAIEVLSAAEHARSIQEDDNIIAESSMMSLTNLGPEGELRQPGLLISMIPDREKSFDIRTVYLRELVIIAHSPRKSFRKVVVKMLHHNNGKDIAIIRVLQEIEVPIQTIFHVPIENHKFT